MEAACVSFPKKAVVKAYLISPAVQGLPQNTEKTGNNLFSVLISFFISSQRNSYIESGDIRGHTSFH